MKTILSFLTSILIFISGFSQSSLIGAWEGEMADEQGNTLQIAVIFTDKHQSISIFKSTGELIITQGGTWHLENDILIETMEYDSTNPEMVGAESRTQIELGENTLTIPEMGLTLKRTDNGTPGKLAGAWLFYSRNIPGKEFTRKADNPRKTMKILSGTRFQWIAYDTESGEIFGSGGGTYSTKNGKYTEKIEFFAKDPSRAGMELEFDYDLKNNNWRHSGLSTKGDPIDETWVRRN